MIKRGKGQFTVPKIQRYDYVFPVFSENGVSIMVPEPCCMPMNNFPETMKSVSFICVNVPLELPRPRDWYA